MMYQVCWKHKTPLSDIWFAQFFKDKEIAKEFYRVQKSLKCEAKILTIKGGKCQGQKQAA